MTSTTAVLFDHTADVLDLVLDHLAVRDWLHVSATDHHAHSVVLAVKGPTICALRDGSVYTNSKLYLRCIANPLLSLAFDRQNDGGGLNTEYPVFEALVLNRTRVIYIPDAVELRLMLQDCQRLMAYDSFIVCSDTVMTLRACPKYDPITCGSYLLDLAATAGMLDLTRELLAIEQPKISPGLLPSLCKASVNIDVFKLVMADPRIDPSAFQNTALSVAAIRNLPHIITLLLADRRVDLSFRDNLLLIEACERGQIAILKILLADDRVDPSARSNKALSVTRCRHDDEMRRMIRTHLRFKSTAKIPI